eukprot:TRINITY_DN33317_c0_g1_i1.p1 TRINITY_DN33317_c0_g1~~TRINITY_DN33317_c0_g1_i1.p1  ORF type:complete len:290 (+),score=145.98 TRINITY_DN33317_c0_g1_i1:50-871(+)
MSATVGGAYGALLAKKKNKNQGEAPKPKTAKVMSLKDTKEKNPAGSVKKEAEPKKQETKKPVKVEEETKELTKREIKAEQKAHDRHQPRSGHAPEKKGQKSDVVSDALDAEKPDLTPEQLEKQKEREEREAKEAEEAKKMTLAQYEKLREEKKKALNMKTSERKVDSKQFAKMTEVTRDDEKLVFGKKDTPKVEVKKNTPAAAKKAAPAKPVENKKKGKFVKTEGLELGIRCSKPQQPRGDRPNNRPPRQEKKEEEKPAAPAPAEEAAPATEE